jgi:tetratricopeptide (TPR) repeat protein
VLESIIFFSSSSRDWIVSCILTLLALSTPLLIDAQCQPLAGSAMAQTPATQNASPTQPEFFDEPKFTVAGVTDTSNPAGHGTATTWRTKEALTKDAVSLSKESSAGAQPATSSIPMEKSLQDAAREPRNFDANHLLGKRLLDDGKAQEAIPYLEQASRLNPGDYENAYELALAYANAGNYEQSRARARALLARDNKDKPELHHLLGDVEEKLGNSLEAVHEFQRAAELDPSESNLFDWGAELLLHHAPEPAIEVFGQGNHLFPGSTRMLVAIGVAWYSRGSYDQAAACLCQASDVNPNDPNPYLFLGKIQNIEATPSEQTAERLKRFASLRPESALANYYYAVSLWKQRKSPEDIATSAQVESLLEKAIHLDPKLGAANLQLGILYSERNDLPKAIAAYQKAIAASPQLEAAHYRLAQAYRQTGDKSKAEHELRLFGELSKEAEKQAERDRHEIQQFVYTLRDQSAQPQ